MERNDNFWLKYLFLILVLGLLILTTTAKAQDAPPAQPTPEATDAENKLYIKEQKKVWRKKARYYKKNPLILKSREETFINEQERYTQELSQMQTAYAELQRIMDSEKQQIQKEVIKAKLKHDSLLTVNDSLRFALGFLADSIDYLHKKGLSYNVSQTPKAQKNPDEPVFFNPQAGDVYYSVQIGAVNKSSYNKPLPNYLQGFVIDSSSQLYRYLLGRFANIGAATQFRNEVRRFGVRDAFVVSYQDGIRITNRSAKKTQKKIEKTKIEQKKGKRSISEEELNTRIANLEGEKQRLITQMDTLKSSRSLAQSEINRLQKQIDELTFQLSQKSIGSTPMDTPPVTDHVQNNLALLADTPPVRIENKLPDGFQVQIYSGNEAGAKDYKKQYEAQYSTHAAIIFYEKPFYKVRVGTFTSHKEAMSYKNSIAKTYKDAFVTKTK